MSRAQTIENIIVSRKPLANRAADTVSQLRKLAQALAEFRDFLPPEQNNQRDDDGAGEKIAALFSPLNKFIGESIPAAEKELAQLERRFRRSTLNIGVVGNARQGKSTFLQALTGLSSEEIPSAAEGHCTGAPSVICNHSSDTYAVVEFYTEDEFL